MDSCDNIHSSLRALLSLVTSSKLVKSEIKQIAESENTSNLTEERNFRNYIEDNETKELRTTQSETSTCLSGSPISAVIGLASSSPTRAIAQALGPFNIPLVRKHMKAG